MGTIALAGGAYYLVSDPMQFILRVGYVKTYPEPVSLRRSVDWFVRV